MMNLTGIFAWSILGKMAKPFLRKWAEKEAIPFLQKKINAGAVDKTVDKAIEVGLKELIDAI